MGGVSGGAGLGLPAAQAPVGGPLPSAATGMGAWHAEWERPRGGFTNGTQTFLDVVHVFQEGEGERGGQVG